MLWVASSPKQITALAPDRRNKSVRTGTTQDLLAGSHGSAKTHGFADADCFDKTKNVLDQIRLGYYEVE